MEFLPDYYIHTSYREMRGLREDDAKFASVISDFLNGVVSSKKKTAEAMANDHRYIVNEKAELFIYFFFQLAVNYHRGWYDARNEWACQCAAIIIEELIHAELFSNYSYSEALRTGDWSKIEL